MPARDRSKREVVKRGVRVFVLSLLGGILGFAVGLFAGIVSCSLYGAVRGIKVDMTAAYRLVAIPVGVAAFVLSLVMMVVLEIRHYRRLQVSLPPGSTSTRSA